jgi:hypothetical protein
MNPKPKNLRELMAMVTYDEFLDGVGVSETAVDATFQLIHRTTGLNPYYRWGVDKKVKVVTQKARNKRKKSK